MSIYNPDYAYLSFATPATLINETALKCTLPPLQNNTSPVFVEVCLSGHPDTSSALGRPARDDVCTTSLVRCVPCHV